MTEPFQIHVSSHFRRDARKLLSQHPELADVLEEVREALRADLTNRSRAHDIAKLAGVVGGEGQWRLRVGQYRLRYDVIGRDVVLYSFRHRREAY
jgi:mRNA-degrading endonuclease RelE of RelBE toxin-antitoxin system